MYSSKNQPSLYSFTPIIPDKDSSTTESPPDKTLATAGGVMSGNSSFMINQRLSDGNKVVSDPSSDSDEDDDCDIVWSTAVEPVPIKQEPSIIKKPENTEYDYMLYIMTKMMERHGAIANLCADDHFRQTGKERHQSSSSSSTSKRGRKRKGK